MKRFLLFSLSCFICSFSYAQSLQSSVLATSGSSFNSGASQLDWTLGETTTSTFSSGSNILTQGFHQPNLLITSVNTSETEYSVNVFPNPTVDLVQLQFKNLKGNISIDLFSAEGQLLRSEKTGNSSMQIPMSAYKAGTYLLSLRDEQSHLKTFRIVKSN